jgi:cytochrome c-type biogenesis protein CcsB
MNTPLSSLQWMTFVDVLLVVGIALSFVSMALHARAKRRGADGSARSPWAARVTGGLLWFAAAGMGLSMWQRYLEVNHFPSQTMSEVLSMFSLALLVSMVALHYALGLRRRGPGWAILDDALIALVFGGALMTHVYLGTLSTAQRDLPPALQSYWFAPHLTALIFSYATLAIAGLICLVYFCMRFWSGVFVGGQPRKLQVLTLVLLALTPFAQVVTLPVLLLCGAIFFGLKLTGNLPGAAVVAKLEKELDDVSFRAFSVGMPFLTAGLWMGAFWAQEAWANYWGWDSKENSALITWLIYVVYIHLRMLGGYRGEKAMAMLMGGALSIFVTFQLFGYLPDSQKSLHRYTDDNVVPREGMQGPASQAKASGAAVRDGEELASRGAAK